MPILFKLVAVCDKCHARHEYESEVKHEGAPERELLNSSDIDHEPHALPGGWKYAHSFMGTELLCLGCEPTREKRRGGW